MQSLKRIFKRNSHNILFKHLAGFGRSLNRLYENRNHDINSNGELTVIKKISKFSPSVIIDGGANTGEYSLAVSRFNPQSKIYAFEPVTATFNELVNNVKGESNIIAVNKGLFSENCNKEINLFSTSPHSSIYDIDGLPYTSTGKEIIELINGEYFMEHYGVEKIDFMKLDLEGAEYNAIIGFSNFFKSGKIKAVQFEFGYINISTKKLLIDFYTIFEEYGYKVGKIFPKIVEFRDYEHKYEDFMGPNYIAVNKNETELIEALTKK